MRHGSIRPSPCGIREQTAAAFTAIQPAVRSQPYSRVTNPDAAFGAEIPEIYQTCLVPLIFEPYAADLANRLMSRSPDRVLELAAGTGVVTRKLASRLPEQVTIVATDLNQSMLDFARARGTARPVEWRQADATELPFDDHAFDAVVCQFGAMFFPDRPKGFSEARRVLRPGGVFIFNVWDRIEHNGFADAVTTALQPLFAEDPPRFLARTPHGYHDRSTIARDLSKAGFKCSADIVTVAECSRAESPRVPAVGFCQGTPLRNEIEARDPSSLGRATDAATAAIAARFGSGAVEAPTQAHVITVDAS